MTNITQEDREAAASFFRDERTGLAVKFRLGCDPSPLLEAFARHREAAEAKERERIVAWLREAWRTDTFEIDCLDIADAIERGDHMEANNATSD